MEVSFPSKFYILPDFGKDMLFSKRDIQLLIRPVILETLLSYLIGLADSLMVSSAGDAAVSAVSLVDSISVLFINIFFALGAGGAVVCGQFLGSGNGKTARKAAEQMMVLMFVISVVCSSVLLVFQRQLIDLLFGSAEKAILDNCNVYYGIVMYSIPFIALYNGGAALFRTMGDSSTPLRISLVMNGINVAGNAVLIYIFKMGVAGAAYPTLFSRFVAMAVILVFLLRREFKLNLRNLIHYRPNGILLKNIVSIGVPNGVENGMFQFGKIILLSLVSTLSTAQITANAIGNVTAAFHCVVGVAVNSAVTAVVSRCAGAHDFKQARCYMKYLVRYVYLVQGLVEIVVFLTIPLIVRLYGATGETARYTVIVMLIHAISAMLIWPLAFMYNTGMRAAGDSRYAMIISSMTMWVFRVAGAYILIKGFGCDLVAVWVMWIVDWIARIAFFIPRYRGHAWETKTIT